jgi:hypothetical protein
MLHIIVNWVKTFSKERYRIGSQVYAHVSVIKILSLRCLKEVLQAFEKPVRIFMAATNADAPNHYSQKRGNAARFMHSRDRVAYPHPRKISDSDMTFNAKIGTKWDGQSI